MLAPNGISRGGREESHRHVLRVHLQLSQRRVEKHSSTSTSGAKQTCQECRPAERRRHASGAPHGKRPRKGLFISLHPPNSILNITWHLQRLFPPKVHWPQRGKALRRAPARTPGARLRAEHLALEREASRVKATWQGERVFPRRVQLLLKRGNRAMTKHDLNCTLAPDLKKKKKIHSIQTQQAQKWQHTTATLTLPCERQCKSTRLGKAAAHAEPAALPGPAELTGQLRSAPWRPSAVASQAKKGDGIAVSL